MSIHINSYYMQTAMQPKEIHARAKLALKGVQFDTIVGTGLSGVLPLLTLAKDLKVHAMAVRKSDDSSHADEILEGQLGERWIFVDDFICSGGTFARVWEAIDGTCFYRGERHQCVGAFLYDAMPQKYLAVPDLRRNHRSIAAAMQAGTGASR